jgi:uncharacterized membrane protein YGL010W
MSRRVDQLFERYGESHRHPKNKAIHWICVPLITWSLLAILWWLSPYAAYALVALAMLFYLQLSVPIAIGMLVVTALMVWPLTLLGERTLPVALAVFVVAWIGQFVGHKIERKKPSFVEDARYLLVGPAWLLSMLYRRVGIRY